MFGGLGFDVMTRLAPISGGDDLGLRFYQSAGQKHTIN